MNNNKEDKIRSAMKRLNEINDKLFKIGQALYARDAKQSSGQAWDNTHIAVSGFYMPFVKTSEDTTSVYSCRNDIDTVRDLLASIFDDIEETDMFSVLVGKTLVSAETNDDKTELTLKCADGSIYRMYHDQNCCESVWLDDVVGDWQDVIGEPILIAEVVTNRNTDDPEPTSAVYTDDSHTWTFYTIRTNRGTVTLRWYGTSNGYYSEDVSFVCEKEPGSHEV